ncbi:hypothetical protein, partial [Vibrio breoganii]|uniref:hypothetical protein n=1 Tax=Vibrio breoganii TaxID=553239 RepID=UPI00056F1A98
MKEVIFMADNPTIGSLLQQVGDIFESNQNKFNRSVFEAQSDRTQNQILQNCRNNGMPVPQISKMTGVPKSTIYSKTTTP